MNVFKMNECKWLARTVCVGMLMLPQSSWGLDWNDPEWTRHGCPENFTGSWREAEKPDGKEIIFSKNSVDFKNFTNIIKLNFKRVTTSKTHGIAELVVVKSQPPNAGIGYIKIRPHWIKVLPKNNAYSKESRCRIKIFWYVNSKDAKRDRYTSWDILEQPATGTIKGK